MKNTELYNESNEATYCPEDNKIRLYVGRVPREEFLELRKEGWTCTPKQPCDFVAHWRVERENTALSYAGLIGDEDKSPADRAADRAERFGGYLDKRRSEAHGMADNFNEGPAVHGFQNQAKAERAAKKHDRLADKSVNLWSKAEYWQSRTAGVISNALYKLKSSVRMGRLKILETSLRQTLEHSNAEENYSRYLNHVRLRIQYEKSMLEASGGCASDIDMVVGGYLSGFQIHTVNKSNASKKITSVRLINNDGSLQHVNIERMEKPEYLEPTADDLQKLKDFKKANKKSLPKSPPLINPNKESAMRLQNIWNSEKNKKPQNYYRGSEKVTDLGANIAVMTQKGYSMRSGGSYSPAKTVSLDKYGRIAAYRWHGGERIQEEAICKVRLFDGNYPSADHLVMLSDKPQKDLPEFAPIPEKVEA